jgi:uncharacterized Zn finger protein (UPF0148 family)
MSTGITNYQCPNCTGPLQFSGETGKLECEYCGSSFEVSVIESLYAAKDQANVEAKERIDAMHQAGLEVNCWTVDDPARAEELAQWGVDYITSNILE